MYEDDATYAHATTSYNFENEFPEFSFLKLYNR